MRSTIYPGLSRLKAKPCSQLLTFFPLADKALIQVLCTQTMILPSALFLLFGLKGKL